jgi:UDP-N-acetylglucosamine--N-acetylmuramyl-(pentapeptide) pyrophosphoryl-undecaprenol N-acetylglucosamine transferase
VFLPYPYHKDQHQKRNAEPLVRAGAAIVLDDQIEGEKNLAAHAGVLTALLGDSARFAALAEPAARLGPADGAARVAKALLGRLEAERVEQPAEGIGAGNPAEFSDA